MKNIITFSGWGQNFDALENIAPGAKHIDYRDFQNVDEVFSTIKNNPCDILIGWSLGGQLALRAIEAGILSPKLLILLATPFQFVMGKGLKCGVDIDTFSVFENNFIKDQAKVMAQFALLVAKNDNKSKEIIKILNANNKDNLKNWLFWLEELGSFSCQKVDFSKMPKTIAIHGRDDAVVDATQTSLFRPLIKNYHVERIDDCGHAPHLHDPELIKKIIAAA